VEEPWPMKPVKTAASQELELAGAGQDADDDHHGKEEDGVH
jgi:hypothetical protein